MIETVPRYTLKLVREPIADTYNKTISGPDRLFETVRDIGDYPEEVFIMLAMDTQNSIIGRFEVSRGTLNSSLVHPREVFKRALLANARSIAVVHNHPSGDTTPSVQDIEVTEQLIAAGELLAVPVMDHLIIGDGDYLSIREYRPDLWEISQ